MGSHTNDHSTVLEVDLQEWVVTPRQQEGLHVEVETGVDVDEWSHTNDHSTVLEVDMQEWVVTPMTTALCWKLTCRSG